jgi:hypothetical protein
VYSDGLVWGGYAANELRVGGATYRYGLQAGPILPDGRASNAMDPLHRVFRLRRVNRSAYALLDLTEQQRLRSDFTDWPAQLGAPYEDVNGNGLYDPDFEAWLDNGSAVDHPQFPGEQILWFVSNDLDASRTWTLYFTAPVGLEMQVFAWAGTEGPLCDNTIFIEYTLANRGPAAYEDMRIARWSDPDLGMFNNDCVGVDSALALQYVYNGKKDDTLFSAAPPAFGYVWLQTPLAPGGVNAGYGRDSREGFHNVPLDAFMFYLSGDPVFEDPDLGTPEGAEQIWWNMSGRSYGGTVVDPTSNEETKFALNGDPVLGAGWIDGIVHKPGDRRQIGTTAGVDLAVGDTQKVVLALTVAEGGNHLLSVRALRNSARRSPCERTAA